MVRKSFIMAMTAVIGAASVFMLSPGCSKEDEEDPSAKIIGSWSGVTVRVRDTFTLDINFPNASNYSLMRSHVTCSSSSCTVDSMREIGTWAVNGDNVVLTLTDCARRQSYETEFDTTIDCSGFPHTGTIPIGISNDQWTFSMVEWRNGDTISYSVTKQ
jgi:hypothetical protein